MLPHTVQFIMLWTQYVSKSGQMMCLQCVCVCVQTLKDHTLFHHSLLCCHYHLQIVPTVQWKAYSQHCAQGQWPGNPEWKLPYQQHGCTGMESWMDQNSLVFFSFCPRHTSYGDLSERRWWHLKETQRQGISMEETCWHSYQTSKEPCVILKRALWEEWGC